MFEKSVDSTCERVFIQCTFKISACGAVFDFGSFATLIKCRLHKSVFVPNCANFSMQKKTHLIFLFTISLCLVFLRIEKDAVSVLN